MTKFCCLGVVGCLIGIGLRLFFMPISLHADLLWIHVFPPKLAYEGVIDFYKYYMLNFNTLANILHAYYYGPLAYFLLGAFHFIYKLFLPSLSSWLNTYLNMLAAADVSHYLDLFSIPFGRLALYLTLLKLPYLIFDIVSMFLLITFLKKAYGAAPLQVAGLWLLNPAILFGSYIFGQLDIFITFLLVASLLFIYKGRFYVSVLCIGLAALFKPSPFILIPATVILLGRDKKHVLGLFFASLLPAIVSVAIFYPSSGTQIFMSLFPGFIVSKGANVLDTIEFSVGKLIFIVGYLFLLWKILDSKRNGRTVDSDRLWRYFTVILLLSYFTVFTPVHYFQWVVPFLIIAVVSKTMPRWIYIVQMIFLFFYAINSRSLCMQLFLPLNPEFFFNLKSLPEYMCQFLNWGVVMRLSRWAFDICSLFIIYKLLFKTEEKSA